MANKGGHRGQSLDPKGAPGQRDQSLHRTIDDNLILNKMIHRSQQKRDREYEETMNDRMRIFEDEIIKRIKVI
jgi:adenylate kinase family enzyme